MGKVVVTGAKGGTGPSIVKIFREADYEVIGVDLKPCEFAESDYRQVNLEDGAAVHDVFKGADAVVHFGSYPTDSWTAWENAYRNLALGGYHVLQAAANLGIPRVVLASSPEIYGDLYQVPYLPIDEDTPPNPHSIYGAVKQNLETLASHYSRWHGIAIAALRPQRIVYEESYEWRFRNYTENDSAAENALWSYIDARDVATACLAWVTAKESGFNCYNIAADDVCVTTPTRQLIEIGFPHIKDIRGDLPERTGLVSCNKIKQLLGWSPQHHWQAMAAESIANHYPTQVPQR